MNSLEKKAVEHIAKNLKEVESYPVYSVFIDALNCTTEEGKREVTKKYENMITGHMKRINEAKEWAETLLKEE